MNIFSRIMLVCIRRELCIKPAWNKLGSNGERKSERDSETQKAKQNMKTSTYFISPVYIHSSIFYCKVAGARWIWFLFRAMLLQLFRTLACSLSFCFFFLFLFFHLNRNRRFGRAHAARVSERRCNGKKKSENKFHLALSSTSFAA